ncbi:MAG: hypothetical protein MUE46_00030 [Xanthomonadales bacterium]|nr:hypothetical protein [Xanthomonadales bacterium]
MHAEREGDVRLRVRQRQTPPGLPMRAMPEAAFQRAFEGRIQRIADAGRAVGAEVVVAVLAFLRADRAAQMRDQPARLGITEVQFLQPDLPPRHDVVRQISVGVEGDGEIAHLAEQEAGQEARLLEVEVAEIEGHLPALGILDQDRVVTVALPVLLAGRHRRQRDAIARRRCRRQHGVGPGHRRLAGPAGGHQPEQQPEQQQAANRELHAVSGRTRSACSRRESALTISMRKRSSVTTSPASGR